MSRGRSLQLTIDNVQLTMYIIKASEEAYKFTMDNERDADYKTMLELQ